MRAFQLKTQNQRTVNWSMGLIHPRHVSNIFNLNDLSEPVMMASVYVMQRRRRPMLLFGIVVNNRAL